MRYGQAYTAALQAMSKGDIYYIPCLNKALVLVEKESALNLNNSILEQAQLRGHVEMIERNQLAERFTLTQKGQRELLKILESHAWESKA